MSAAKLELELRTALLETGLVQPIFVTSKAGHIEALCRQVPGQEKAWLMVVSNLLLAGEEAKLQIHLCRRYVLKDRQMKFGWHLQIDSKGARSLKRDVEIVCAELAEAKPSLDEPAQPAQPARRYQPQYETDAQVTKRLGLGERDAEAGYMGRVVAEPKLDLSQAEGTDPRSPSLRVVSRTRTQKGENYELEMPLPHIKREMNVPKHPNGKGAKRMGDN